MKTHLHNSMATAIAHEGGMSQVEQMAEFVNGARFEALGSDTREQLKIRILDSLGCSLGALHVEPIRMIRSYITELGSCGSGSINERAGCGTVP